MTTLIKLSTAKTVDEVAVALQAVVPANHLDVTHVYNLKEMTKRGVKFASECVIFEVGKLPPAKDEPDEDLDAATALPCRISIYVKGGKTILAALKPTSLMAIFNAPQLIRVARQVEATIVKIMREAARGGRGNRVPA